jgi:hypothetical protein
MGEQPPATKPSMRALCQLGCTSLTTGLLRQDLGRLILLNIISAKVLHITP